MKDCQYTSCYICLSTGERICKYESIMKNNDLKILDKYLIRSADELLGERIVGITYTTGINHQTRELIFAENNRVAIRLLPPRPIKSLLPAYATRGVLVREINTLLINALRLYIPEKDVDIFIEAANAYLKRKKG